MVNNDKIVRLLLMAGANLNKRDGKGRTVFHIIVCYRAMKAMEVIMTEYLLDCSTVLRAQDYQGEFCYCVF